MKSLGLTGYAVRMALSRKNLLLKGFVATALLIGATIAIAQQIKRIDDTVLKTAGQSTEWTMNGMDWGEQIGRAHV